jgi:serine protease
VSLRPAAALVVSAALALAGAATTAARAAEPAPAPHGSTADPFDPSYLRPYRHGAIPTLDRLQQMRQWAAQHAGTTAAVATGTQTLSYGGGIDGIGVQSGVKNKVYLVFYGRQWGTQGTDSHGDATFSGDPHAATGAAQEMFKDIGTGGELWSADLTQWCDGAGVATGATSCPATLPASQYVPYQSGGVLAGVWYDSSVASPSSATQAQLAQEAVNAAAHFGNTTAAANRHTYYVILSPTGTDPDAYQGQYCAWHDYTPSAYGDLAYANQPYNLDQGAGCGVDFVSPSGTLDGWTMTLGHEWHEQMSDQNPLGGWSNHTGSSSNGEENSDECAWIGAGQPGASAYVTMGSGTFAEQSSWSNDTNACAMSHPVVSHGAVTDSVSVAAVAAQTWTAGTAASVQASGSSTTGKALTWSATGLPAGLSVNSATGLVSGTPTTAGSGTAKVTATDSTPASGSAAFSWTVNPAVTSGAAAISNGGFETGTFAGWTLSGAAQSVTRGAAHSGLWGLTLGSTSATTGDSNVAQTFTAPAGAKTLAFWYNVTCPDNVQYDWATATLTDNSTGVTTQILAKTCVAASGWLRVSAGVTGGHGYTLVLTSHDDGDPADPTYTMFDDVAVS